MPAGSTAGSALALVDLFAVLPFYLPIFFPFDLRFLRILRLVRIFRVFKMARYLEDLQVMLAVFKNKKDEMVITVFLVVVMLLLSVTLIYQAEHQSQPHVFSSLPAALWRSVVTPATIGSGDMCLVTPVGGFLGGLIALFGIGLFALPAGILASGFIEEMKKADGRHHVPPLRQAHWSGRCITGAPHYPKEKFHGRRPESAFRSNGRPA